MRLSTAAALQVMNQHLESARALTREGCSDASGLLDCLLHTLTEVLPEVQRAAADADMLFESAPVGYHEIDAQGRIVRVNRTELRMLGYALEDMLGRPVWEFLEDPAAAQAVIEGNLARQPGDGTPFERAYRCRDGRLLPVLVGERILRNGESAVSGVFTTIQDLTDLRAAAAEADAADQNYRALVLHMSEGLALHRLETDAEGAPIDYTLLEVNPQFEAMLGLCRELVVGRRASEIYQASPPPYLAECAAVVQTGDPRRFEAPFALAGKTFQVSIYRTSPGEFATVFVDVTEEERVKRDLAETNRELRSLLENSLVGVYKMTRDGRFLYANERLAHILGYPSSDRLMAQSLAALYPHRADRVAFLAAIKAAGGRLTGYEVRFQSAIGEPRHGLITAQMVGPLISGVVVDTTDLKQAEARFKALVDQAPLGVAIVCQDGRPHYLNAQFTTSFGFALADLADADAWRQATGLPGEPGRVLPVREQALTAKDGRACIVEVRTTRVGDLVVYLFDDVTDRKRRTHQLETVRRMGADLARELDTDSLVELVARHTRDLLGDVGVAVYLLDAGSETLIPRAVHVQDGYPLRTLLKAGEGLVGAAALDGAGRIVLDTRYWTDPLPEVPAAKELALSLLAEPLCFGKERLGAILVTSTDPRRRFRPEDRDLLGVLCHQATIALSNARLFSELNDSYKALAIARDEQVRVEKLRALGQLSAGIAHDLNNMLAAILSQAELIPYQLPHAGLTELLAPIQQAAKQGATIVRRIQDFASQKSTASRKPCNLRRIVEDALEITRPRWRDEAHRGGIALEVQCDCANLPDILGEATEIREAVANIVLNAVDAMPEGGRLAIDGAVEAERVLLRITDTGVGMTAETQARIFDPFFTTKPQGSGLGLSQAYGIMERLLGRISVASTPGAGTTFTLSFDRAEPPTAARGPAPAALGPTRVLVIDDEPAVREAIAELLKVSGHLVEAVASGEAALAYLAGHPRDVVLTDLGMAGMNGWQLAAAVAERHPGLPVVLMTGWLDMPSEPLPDRARATVAAVLSKPVALDDLLATLQKAVASAPAPVGR